MQSEDDGSQKKSPLILLTEYKQLFEKDHLSHSVAILHSIYKVIFKYKTINAIGVVGWYTKSQKTEKYDSFCIVISYA